MRLAFPDDEHPPTCPTKRGNAVSISNLGLLSLGLPETRVCLRSALAAFASVHMPEAAMYKDHTVVPGQDKIRCSGKLPVMDSKSIAERVDKSAYDHFRLCIGAPYRCHAS